MNHLAAINAMTHAEIYEAVHRGPGGGAAMAAEDAWQKAQQIIVAAEQRTHAAITASANEWEGTGADAARSGLTSLNRWVLEAVTDARNTAGALTEQGTHAGTLRHSIPRPHAYELFEAQSAAMLNPADRAAADRAARAESTAQDPRVIAHGDLAKDRLIEYVNTSYDRLHAMSIWTVPPTITVDTAPAPPRSPAVTGPGDPTPVSVAGAGAVPGVGGALGPHTVAPGGVAPVGPSPGGPAPGGVAPGGVGPGGRAPGGTAPGGVGPGGPAPSGPGGPGGPLPGGTPPGVLPGPGGTAPGRAPGTAPSGQVPPGGVAPGGPTPASPAGRGPGTDLPSPPSTGGTVPSRRTPAAPSTGNPGGVGPRAGDPRADAARRATEEARRIPPGGGGRGVRPLPDPTWSAPASPTTRPSVPGAPALGWRELVARESAHAGSGTGAWRPSGGLLGSRPDAAAPPATPRPDPRGPSPVADAGRSSGSGSSHGMYPPMGGAGTGQQGEGRRRAPYLIDDSGAFDVSHIPYTDPVIGGEPEPRP